MNENEMKFDLVRKFQLKDTTYNVSAEIHETSNVEFNIIKEGLDDITV